MTTAPDSLTTDRIADYADVRVLNHTVELELHPAPIAWLTDMPGYVSYMVYEFPVQGTSNELVQQWSAQEFDKGPRIEILPCSEPLVLPTLTRDDAEECAQHAYFSGASLMITTQVCARRGTDAMHDYADTQNMYSMPGAPKIPIDELKWFGSGL